jgi:hypothetical protein
MTIINSNYSSNGYYQLGSQQNTAATTTGPTSLAEALQAIDNKSGDSAYELNLSSDANDYLQSLLEATNTQSSGTNSADSIPDNFTLTPDQQNKLISILDKYKDAPQTQETFNQIQDDLKQAGLDPDTLAAKEQANNFNPTAVLIAIMSGQSSTDTNPTDPQQIQSKYNTLKSNYLQQVAEMWEKRSNVNAAS